jgi:hypothetical protein
MGFKYFAEFFRRPVDGEGAVGESLDLARDRGARGAIGIPLAFLFGRADFPGRRALGR